MALSRLVPCLAVALALQAAGTALAEGVTPSGFDYDALVEELPIAAPRLAPSLTFGVPGGGLTTVYGQLNLAFQSFDDGQEVTSGLVDNGNWNSRLGFTVSNPLASGTLRYRFETGLGLRSSAQVSQVFTPPVIDWQPANLRWFEAAWEGEFGTVSVGQGSSASDGTAGLDDSFTFVAGAADASDGFGAFQFRDGTGALSGITVGQVNSTFNGARRFRIRYDTPLFSGVMFSTSYGVNILNPADDTDYSDIALRWTGELGDFGLRSALGYQWLATPGAQVVERIAGSATVSHGPSGLNLSVSAGEQVGGARYLWTRAGWQHDFVEAGTTSLSVDWYDGQDFLTPGAQTGNWGVYAVQSFDAASLDLYAGWRQFSYSDLSGSTYQAAGGVLAGARFAF